MSQPFLATWEMQVALYSLLKRDAVLANGVTGVFDGTAPDDTNLPYVVIDSWLERGDDVHNHISRELSCNITVWSSYEGLKQASTYANHICMLLDHQTLVTDSWATSIMRLEDSQALVAPNGDRQLILRMYFKVSPK